MEGVTPIDLKSTIEATSWGVYRNFKNYVQKEDLQQEGWLWAAEHPERLNMFLEHENPKQAYFWLSRTLWEVMDKYARSERAQFLGYETSDEAFYGKALVETLLPAVLHGDTTPSKSGDSTGPSTSDPAEGGAYLAMYLDVQHALSVAELAPRERQVVALYYGEGLSQEDTANELQIQQPAVSKALRRITEKLIDKLGGRPPSNCPNDCECHKIDRT